MTDGIEVVGAGHLAEAGRRLKDAGNGDLRRELLAGIRAAAKKTIPEIQREARDLLPHAGGLGERIAGQKFAVRTSLASGRVTLTGSGMQEMADIDRGHVRKPVFGNRDMWVAQSVTPGFFTKPTTASAPRVRAEIEHALSDVAHKIERPL